MTQYKLNQINQIARAVLAFVLFYHGLVPKILFPSETELMLVQLHQLPIDAALFSQMAGISEMLLACLIVLLRTALWPVYIAMLLLFFLLLDVWLVMPALLVAAFNPVSINVAGLALATIIIISQD